MDKTIGFYGGKFLPMHKGHLYCIDTAAKKCNHVVVIMFINGDDELNVLKTQSDESLSVEARIKQVKRVCSLYSNVEFHIIDVLNLKLPDRTGPYKSLTKSTNKIVLKCTSCGAPLHANTCEYCGTCYRFE